MRMESRFRPAQLNTLRTRQCHTSRVSKRATQLALPRNLRSEPTLDEAIIGPWASGTPRPTRITKALMVSLDADHAA